jgi:ATP-binding cassette subfamily F protein 3
MSLLSASGLRRQYGAREVLRGLELRIEAGERVGLVGRNGDGKTTLLRLLEGEETPDAGTVELARGARLGYVAQHARFPAGTSVWQWVEGGLEEARKTAEELHAVGDKLSHAQGEEQARLMARHGELSARMDFLGGWETERRTAGVLRGIGLSEELWQREAGTLSGGEKSRVLLARELVAAPDLLLLDEPTNHLDLPGIEWLEAFLLANKGAVLVVSHDRRLLDRIATSMLELERGVLKRYPGNYSAYVRIKEERFESERRAYELQRDTIRREEEFIRRHMGSQRTAEAKGRQKKLENLVRLVEPFNDVRRPVIRMAGAERGGELVFEARGLSVGHPGKLLVSGLELRLGRGDRMGIVGANGSGKTTLLKVLAGRAPPRGGELTFGHKAKVGYFDQETAELGLGGGATPFERLRRAWPQKSDEELRSHLARFLFRGEQVDADIHSLSGGERARLALALLVLEQPSWLALDEPTNHLDLAARTALEEFLGEFAGALVCISHDRAFLDGLCTSVLELEGGRARRHEGNYSAWREHLRAEQAAEQAAEQQRQRAQEQKELKERERAEARAAASGASAPASSAAPAGRSRNPWLLKKVEESIIKHEAERDALLASMTEDAVYRDSTRLREAQVRLAEVERELQEMNLEWERWI